MQRAASKSTSAGSNPPTRSPARTGVAPRGPSPSPATMPSTMVKYRRCGSPPSRPVAPRVEQDEVEIENRAPKRIVSLPAPVDHLGRPAEARRARDERMVAREREAAQAVLEPLGETLGAIELVAADGSDPRS